jgi:hypothetical protein
VARTGVLQELIAVAALGLPAVLLLASLLTLRELARIGPHLSVVPVRSVAAVLLLPAAAAAGHFERHRR